MVVDPKQLSKRLGAADATKGRGSRDPVGRSLDRFRKQVARRATASVSAGFFHGISSAAKLHPLADPSRHDVELINNIEYSSDGHPDHVLDIYRPTKRTGPFPVIFYVHGGGFRLLSKDTHWVMGLIFAKFGYLVVNISYRLAPKYPFPAAIMDACEAWEWAVKHVSAYGGDPQRMSMAGESAGANLVTALTVVTCYRRKEPWARRVFDLGVTPRATIPAAGILQVSDTERFSKRRKLPFWVNNVLLDVTAGYLRGARAEAPGELDLADPLVLFERGDPPDRPLPPFFAFVGTKDPLLDDTRRLEVALNKMGVTCEAHFYKGEIHAFHAFVWRRPARRCWRDTFAFLDRHVRRRGPVTTNDRKDDSTVAAAQ